MNAPSGRKHAANALFWFWYILCGCIGAGSIFVLHLARPVRRDFPPDAYGRSAKEFFEPERPSLPPEIMILK